MIVLVFLAFICTAYMVLAACGASFHSLSHSCGSYGT